MIFFLLPHLTQCFLIYRECKTVGKDTYQTVEQLQLTKKTLCEGCEQHQKKKLKNRGTRTQATAGAPAQNATASSLALILNQRNDKSHLIKRQRWLFKKL